MKNIFIGIFISLLFFSCDKQAGEGGLNTLEGVVYVQNISPVLEKVGKKYPAQDENVYIQYGDSKKVNDKTATGSDGYFSFEYLTQGDYTIFAYSDDTASAENNMQISISKTASLTSKKETSSTDTLIIYKYVDYDQGKATLTGKVDKIYYFTGNVQPKTPIPAQNEEVFLVNQQDKGLVDRVRTTFDGEYKFANVLPGDYMVYVLSDQLYKDEDLIDSVLVTVTEDSNLIELTKLSSNKF